MSADLLEVPASHRRVCRQVGMATVLLQQLFPREAKAAIASSVTCDPLHRCTPQEAALVLAESNLELFAAIRPLEYVAHLWQSKVRLPSTHVQAFTDRFNWIGNWTKERILRHRNTKRCAEAIRQSVDLALACRDLGDFNSLFSVLSGLVSPAVSRLKRAWARVPAKHRQAHAELEAMMDPSRNMNTYRTLFAEVCLCVCVCLCRCLCLCCGWMALCGEWMGG